MTTPPYPQQPGQAPPPPYAPGPQAGPVPTGYPQGAYPAYASAPYPPSTEPGVTSRRNTLGLVSVIVGAVPLLLGLISPFVTLLAYHGTNYDLIGLANAILNGIGFLLGLAALIIGLIAVTRKGLPKALAGIGIGLGIGATWGGITALLYPVVLQFAF